MGCAASTPHNDTDVPLPNVTPAASTKAPHAPTPLGTKVPHACMDEGNKAAGALVVAETEKLAKGGHHAQLVEEDVEERVAQATANFETELQVFEDEAQGGDLVELGEQLLTYFGKAVGALDSQERQVGRTDISSLALEDRSLAEARFCKCSAVGQVLVSTLQHGLAALPFGAPVGAVIGVIFARAAQAAHNATAAQRLLRYIKAVDLRLARLLAAKDRGRLDRALDTHLRRLGTKLDVAARLMFAYSGRGFLIRSLMSSYDKDNFANIERDIREIMQDITQDHMLDRMDAEGDESLPKGDSVLKELCKLAGEPHEGKWDEARVERLLAKLQRGNPQALKGVLKASARLEDKIIASELSALEGRVTKLEATTDEHGKQIVELSNTVTWLMYKVAAAYDKCQGPISLKTYLKDWWNTVFKREQRRQQSVNVTIQCNDFVDKLKMWINSDVPDGESELKMFDEDVKAVMGDLGLSLAALEGSGNAFLDHVFARELDENADGLVTQDELLSVQMKAEKYAKLKFKDEAQWTLNNWLELLNSIFMGFDRDSLVPIASEKLVKDLEQRLQVKGIIQAYKISTLVAQYVEGTRQWLYDDINKWLDVATARVSDDKSSRMFLLLAGPGMGKSVFSAVMHTHLMARPEEKRHVKMVKHFFKVGEARSQGRAMVVSLAYQVAEKLPGFADLLLPVAEEHGTGTELHLTELFQKYLMAPLQQWDEKNQVKPVLVMLVDALDEADDGNRGCLPVARLLAKEFHALPSFVKIILTARKQIGDQDTAQFFGGWAPMSIQPENSRNMEDMEKLLTLRLQSSDSQVPAEELQAAVEVLARKSKGEFIYAKYALFCMRLLKKRWTAAELEVEMPEGLGGAYELIMMQLTSVLCKYKPELLELLTDKVLPVLVASREPLSPDLVAWACGYPEWRSDNAGYADLNSIRARVKELLEALVHLFPTRPAPGGGMVVQPYHKSVLDWFKCEADMDAGQFRVRTTRGHELLGLAGEAYCRAELEAQPNVVVATDLCNGYALRHTLAHMCLAGQPVSAAPLERLLLNFGFWQHAYTAGAGPGVVRDLLEHSSASPVVKDVARWLRACSAFLAKFPEATMQVAVDSPSDSLVAKAAARLPSQPPARLLTKEANWPALMGTFFGHINAVNCVATSHDGNFFVSASDDKTLRVWDAASGEVKGVLEGHTDEVTSVAISADSKTIVSGSADSTVRVWDLASGLEKSKLEGHTSKVCSVAISPDGNTIVSGSENKTVRVWDMLTGQQKSVLEGHTSCVNSVAISPDGKTIVSGSGSYDGAEDNTVRVWDMLTGQQKSVLKGHTGDVNSVAISPDGKTIVSGSDDMTVRVWDLLTGQQKSKLEGHIYGVSSVVISPDGKTIVSSSLDETVRVWDMVLGQEKSKLEGHTDVVFSVAISPDGKTIVSGSKDKTVRVWDLLTGQHKSVLEGHTSCVNSVAISPDGKTIVSGSDDRTVRVWDALTGQQKSKLEGHTSSVESVAISPDGKTIVSGSLDNTVRMWDLLTGQQNSVLEGHTNWVLSVAISPDGKTIVSGSGDSTVRVWDMLTGQHKSVLEGHTDYVNSVAISPDGKTIVSGSYDNTVRVWGMEDGKEKEVLRGEEAELKCQAMQAWGNPEANLVTKSSDGNGQVVDLMSSSTDNVIATVYITPPFQLRTDRILVSGANKKLAAFTMDNKFLRFEI